MGWIFTRLADGSVEVDLDEDFREVLEALPAQLEEALQESPGAPDLARLAPPAYADQPEYEEEYRRFMADDLRARQLDALAVLRSTAGAEVLTEEQAQGWMGALNSLRLVLGTQLDVSDDDDVDDGLDDLHHDVDDDGGREADEEAALWAAKVQLYRYLTALLGDLIEALSEGLPPATATGPE